MNATTTCSDEQLQRFIEAFETLNPLVVDGCERDLFRFAQQANDDAFEPAREFAESVIERYLASPVKTAERRVLREFFSLLDQTSARLIAAGEIPAGAPPEHDNTLALVPDTHFTDLQWLRVQSRAPVPVDVANAVEAAQTRNVLAPSVLETLFRWLQALNSDEAFRWQLALIARHDGRPDPDIARDLIRAWSTEPTLPLNVLRQAIAWADDENAFRLWPTIVREADKLLRIHTLRRWSESTPATIRLTTYLQRLAPFTNEQRLIRCLDACVTDFGTRIDFFIKQADVIVSHQTTDIEWRQNALFRELLGLRELLPPLLVLSDILLSTPNGAYLFAMAVFGFTTDEKRAWNRRLDEKSRDTIRRAFLWAMKQRETPLNIIEKLCFGDDDLFASLTLEIDYLSKEFDSIAQRELVVDKLVSGYSSYREAPLLMTEIGHRYRRMMRMLHEDSIRQLLRAEQFDAVAEFRDVLIDLSVIASESRKFLNTRRNLQKDTDEIMVADSAFQRTIRGLRTLYCRRLLEHANTTMASAGTPAR